MTKAIPKMAGGAVDRTLRAALESHLIETEKQVARLEQAATMGLIQEGAEVLAEMGDETVLESGNYRSRQPRGTLCDRGYLTAINLAKRIDAGEVAMLPEQSLTEEREAERKLRAISGDLVKTAATVARGAA